MRMLIVCFHAVSGLSFVRARNEARPRCSPGLVSTRSIETCNRSNGHQDEPKEPAVCIPTGSVPVPRLGHRASSRHRVSSLQQPRQYLVNLLQPYSRCQLPIPYPVHDGVYHGVNLGGVGHHIGCVTVWVECSVN